MLTLLEWAEMHKEMHASIQESGQGKVPLELAQFEINEFKYHLKM